MIIDTINDAPDIPSNVIPSNVVPSNVAATAHVAKCPLSEVPRDKTKPSYFRERAKDDQKKKKN